MTESYKNILTKYITGTLEEQTGNNVPYFDNPVTIQNNFYSYCNQKFGDYFTVKNIIQPNNSSNFVCWGNKFDMQTLKNVSKIVILDNNFNVVQAIEEYTSGVSFGEFIDLKIDENGNFYVLEKFNNAYRFMMLNNISLKLPTEDNYKVKIRKSYAIPSEYQNNEFINITKSENNDYYCFFGNAIPNTKMVALELRVNVGIDNEWNFFSSAETSDFIVTGKGFATWDNNNNIHIKIGASIGNVDYQYYAEYTNNEQTLVRKTFSTELADIISDYAFVDPNTTYVSVNAVWSENGQSDYIYKVNYSSNTLDKIYQKEFAALSSTSAMIKLFITENHQIFFFEVTPTSDDNESDYNIILGKIIDTSIISKDAGTVPYNALSNVFLFVQRNYNLYNVCFQNQNNLIYLTQIYNELNYNGTPYINQNSLVPNTVLLQNNSKKLFDRNLYNLTINGANFTATVEISNQLLNDNNINKETLIGLTNQPLFEGNLLIDKNIYEKVLMNFNNAINMFNEYDNTYNILGASKINKSINTINNYDNAKMTKYRINYKEYNSNTYWNGDSTIYWDGSSEENWEETTTIKDLPTPTIVNNLATYVININTAQGINTIEFLSNDETTVYRTIDLSNYEKNKNLKITQEMEVM